MKGYKVPKPGPPVTNNLRYSYVLGRDARNCPLSSIFLDLDFWYIFRNFGNFRDKRKFSKVQNLSRGSKFVARFKIYCKVQNLSQGSKFIARLKTYHKVENLFQGLNIFLNKIVKRNKHIPILMFEPFIIFHCIAEMPCLLFSITVALKIC